MPIIHYKQSSCLTILCTVQFPLHSDCILVSRILTRLPTVSSRCRKVDHRVLQLQIRRAAVTTACSGSGARRLSLGTTVMASSENVEPFPSFPPSHGASSSPTAGASKSRPAHADTDTPALKRTTSNGSVVTLRTRTTSLTQSFLHSNPPFGICQAAGEVASKIPTLAEIRNGSFSAHGWTEEGQMQERGETPHQIQKRQTSRASSLGMSRRRRSTTSQLSSRMDEQDEFFPSMDFQMSNDANRVPATIPEGACRDIPSIQV